MTDSNPFTAYGADKGRREKPVRVTGKEQPMVLKGLDKKQDEDAKQAKRYRAAQRAELQGMIDGPRGQDVLRLQSLLRSYINDVGREDEVIVFLDDVHWFDDHGSAFRMRILSMIGNAILRARIRDGRPPFDDPIPLLDSEERPAPEGLFQTAKERLSDDDKHGRDDQGNAGEQPEGMEVRPDPIGR